MRCVYCNKKLSLLKLAKGDSFCSAEHFDAHQLQLSKNAFDRLRSVPAEEGPKPPLVLKPRDETPPEPEVRPKAPRRAAEPPRKAIASKPAQRMIEPRESPSAPPYAPFASSPPQMCHPKPVRPFLDMTVATEAEAPKPQVAMPEHGISVTAGVLNLYLRLSLDHLEALDWQGWREQPTATPEEFARVASLPPLNLSPVFPEYEVAPEVVVDPEPVVHDVVAPDVEAPTSVSGQNESEAAIVEALSIPAASDALAPDVEPRTSVSGQNESAIEPIPDSAGMLTHGGSSVDLEETAIVEALSIPATADALAPDVEPRTSVSGQEPATLPVDPPTARPVEAVLPLAASPAPLTNSPIESLPTNAEPRKPGTSLPPAASEEFSVKPEKVAFLIAPSFRTRPGERPVFDDAAARLPSALSLNTTLDTKLDRGRPPLHVIPPAVSWTGAAPLKIRDFSLHAVQGAPELPSAPGFLLPSSGTPASLDGWHSSSPIVSATLTPRKPAHSATAPLGFEEPSPASLLVRAEKISPGARPVLATHSPVVSPMSPSRGNLATPFEMSEAVAPTPSRIVPPAVEPQSRAIPVSSVVREVLESIPRGDRPPSTDFPAQAKHTTSPTILTAFPTWEHFSDRTWSNRTAHFTVPTTIATGAALPRFILEPLPYLQACKKGLAAVAETPSLANAGPVATVWHQTDSAMPAADPAIPAVEPPALHFAEPLAAETETRVDAGKPLPIARAYPFIAADGNVSAAPQLASSVTPEPAAPAKMAIELKVGSCMPAVTWEPMLPTSPEPPALKLLPVRRGPILPAARSWPRLGVPNR